MAELREASAVSIVEIGVPETQQRMSAEKIFWSHFSPNFGAPVWMIGLVLAASGLDLRWGTLAVVVGNVVGAIPTALCALMGPATGLTQIEHSRFAFGRVGTRVPAVLNYLTCVGWVAIANVPAALALVMVLAFVNLAAPFWIALALVTASQMLAAVYGHHVVQLLQKYVGYALVVAFAGMVAGALAHGNLAADVARPFSAATFALGLSVVASNTLSWSPLSSDYTRYVVRSTPPAHVFWLVFLGFTISSIAMELLGFLTARGISNTTPGALIGEVAKLSGIFAPIVLIVLVLASISSSAVNTTTASYSLISSGARLSRPVSAAVAGVFAFVLAALGAGSFTALYTNYLFLLLYWISPWAGIVIAEWYFGGGPLRTGGRWRAGATIFVIVTPVTIALFSSTEIYTGPIANLLGGVDIGYVVGFFAAGLLYLVAIRGSGIRAAEATNQPELA